MLADGQLPFPYITPETRTHHVAQQSRSKVSQYGVGRHLDKTTSIYKYTNICCHGRQSNTNKGGTI